MLLYVFSPIELVKILNHDDRWSWWACGEKSLPFIVAGYINIKISMTFLRNMDQANIRCLMHVLFDP